MKIAIQLINKFNGDTSWLGIKHDSKEAAKAFFEKEICLKCNRAEYYRVDDNMEWVSRKDGFQYPNSLKP